MGVWGTGLYANDCSVSVDIKDLKIKETNDNYSKYFNRFLKAAMIYYKKTHYPEKSLTYIGNSCVHNAEYNYTQ